MIYLREIATYYDDPSSISHLFISGSMQSEYLSELKEPKKEYIGRKYTSSII